jgi:hypothetical protein
VKLSFALFRDHLPAPGTNNLTQLARGDGLTLEQGFVSWKLGAVTHLVPMSNVLYVIPVEAKVEPAKK